MFPFKRIFRPLFDANNEGGGGAEAPVLPEWVATVPFSDETKKSETFIKDISNYKNADDFWKSYRNSQEMVGRKGVIVPKEGDAPEIFTKYRETMGIPDKPESYKINLPEKLHPSIKVTPESQKAFFDFAHKNGFSNAQAESLNNWYLSDLSAKLTTAEKTATETRQKGDAELKQEWGAKYDEYSAQAKRAYEVFGKDKLDPESLNDPNVRRVFQLIGSKISEDTFKSMTTQGGAGDPNVQQQISTILNDPKHPYNVADHPDHKKAVAEMLELNKKVVV